jgi:hypothetical protein
MNRTKTLLLVWACKDVRLTQLANRTATFAVTPHFAILTKA